MLFTGGLLHWVIKAVSHVPRHVNLVLLGSDLPADEVAWVSSRMDRPFHHIRLRLDDPGGWEFLFAVNRHHFGWIGSGAFVLDERIFGEFARIDPGTSLNCAWSWDSGIGFPIARPHLLFVNVDTIAAVRQHRIDACPGMYSYERLNRQVEGRRCYARKPSRAQLRQLRRLLPTDGSGRPVMPHTMTFFDTMVMYQLLARSYGFDINLIRDLEGFGHVHGREVEDESSDELFYIGALSYADVLEEFSGYFHDAGVRLLYLIAEYVILARSAGWLPEHYQKRLEQITAELSRQGLSPQAAREAARSHLIEGRGMSAEAADSVLRPAEIGSP
jgi:hypothetical protein